MEKELIGSCPVCSNKLIATNLYCRKCDLELKGDFALNNYSYLAKEDLEFLELFLIAEGNFKAIQEKLGISYLKAKERLTGILKRLGLKQKAEVEEGKTTVEQGTTYVGVEENDHFVVRLIKTKLNDNKGRAVIPLITAGKTATIEFDDDGSGLVCDKIPIAKQLTWDVFEASYNILIMNDGEIYKGYARTGKLGSERLPVDSLEGYIAYAVHGIEEGASAFSPGFVIAAILDWVGILKNERGSTLRMINEIAAAESYDEALKNAVTFNKALQTSELLKSRLSFFRHWYYFSEADLFAPSKFIGYKDMNVSTYEAFTVSSRNELDGRGTLRTLERFFKVAPKNSAETLIPKLTAFLSQQGSDPNARSVIHVKK